MAKHLVSVIVPTYNRANYIKECIDSVSTQKLPRNHALEVLVIDDGSTDNTAAVLNKFGDKIKYFKIPHSGLPAVARNFGLAKAKGDLIAFQDSDDLWKPGKLARQLPAFDEPEVVLCCSNAEIIDGKGRSSGKTILEPKMGKSGYVFEDLLRANFVSTLTVLARKEATLRAGGFNESSKLRGVEDYELWLRLASIGKFHFVNEPLALHRQHSLNISLDLQQEMDEHILSVFRSILHQPLNRSQKLLVRREIISKLKVDAESATGLTRLSLKTEGLAQRALARLTQ